MNNKPYPPPAYDQPSTSQPTVILSNTAIALGPDSQRLICPHCHANISTRVESEASLKTHIIAYLLCGICCCCIPYCTDSCMDQKHYCPSCKAYLGKHKN